MSAWYIKIALTIIALPLAAITTKLYLPAPQLVGPQTFPPTRGDMRLARSVENPFVRRVRLEELKSRPPFGLGAVWRSGGEGQCID